MGACLFSKKERARVAAGKKKEKWDSVTSVTSSTTTQIKVVMLALCESGSSAA